MAYGVILWDIVLLTRSLVLTLTLDPYVMVIMHDPHVYGSIFFSNKWNWIVTRWQCFSGLLLIEFESFIFYVSPQARSLSLCVWGLKLSCGIITLLNNSQSFFPPYDLSDEIAFLEGMTIVYKSSIDLFFYVVGSAQENEVSLSIQHKYSMYLLMYPRCQMANRINSNMYISLILHSWCWWQCWIACLSLSIRSWGLFTLITRFTSTIQLYPKQKFLVYHECLYLWKSIRIKILTSCQASDLLLNYLIQSQTHKYWFGTQKCLKPPV